MRLGLLADIHEEVELLRRAIDALYAAGVSRFIILGDIFDTGKSLDATVELLAGLDSQGVWGNHDFGLCRDVDDEVSARFSSTVLGYFSRLEPWIEEFDCRFQHIEPFLDSECLYDLWSYGGTGRLDSVRSFEACRHRRIFIGHVHRWELLTPAGITPWRGQELVRLNPGERYLAVIHAVQQGWCAWYDPVEDVLCPLRVAE